jgi:hypothetical protein
MRYCCDYYHTTSENKFFHLFLFERQQAVLSEHLRGPKSARLFQAVKVLLFYATLVRHWRWIEFGALFPRRSNSRQQ